jgi:hypothetical protein
MVPPDLPRSSLADRAHRYRREILMALALTLAALAILLVTFGN